MCGIVGVASSGPMTIPLKELFQSLLYHDVVRGHHATGIAAIDTNNRATEIAKAATPAPEFLGSDECEQLFLPKHNYNIYIGHNRWATSGDKTKDEYAHPFEWGNIVGVHNGSLVDQTLLDNHKEFVVDSDNIFYHMCLHGLDDTIKKMNGAFSLVWYDSEDNTLNFLRNSERPMAIAKLSGNTWVWASEMSMLRWLIKRHKLLRFEQIEDDNDKTKKEDFCYQLAPGSHYKIPFNGRHAQKPVMKKKTLPDFPVIPWRNGSGAYGGYSNYDMYDSRTNNRNYQKERQDKHLVRISNKLKVDNSVEVKLVEIFYEHVFVTSSNTTEPKKRFVFEYKTHNDIIPSIKFWNAGYDPFFNVLDDKNIGETFYGKISYCAAALDSANASIINHVPGAPSNDTGVVCSLFSVSRIKPSCFMSYNETVTELNDDMPPDIDSEDNEPNGNVIDENTIEVSSKGVALQKTKKQLRSERRLARRLARERLSSGSGASKPSIETKTGVFIQLFNCRVDRIDMINLSKSCHHRCSNCDKALSSIKLADIYVITQKDDDGVGHQYALCSSGCYKEMKQWAQEFDDATIIEGYAK